MKSRYKRREGIRFTGVGKATGGACGVVWSDRDEYAGRAAQAFQELEKGTFLKADKKESAR
jgi:hypothetical protein